jgi:hypothetical protein
MNMPASNTWFEAMPLRRLARGLSILALAVLAAACAPKQAYEGAERAPEEVAVIQPIWTSATQVLFEVLDGKPIEHGHFSILPGMHTITARVLRIHTYTICLPGLNGAMFCTTYTTILGEHRGSVEFMVEADKRYEVHANPIEGVADPGLWVENALSFEVVGGVSPEAESPDAIKLALDGDWEGLISAGTCFSRGAIKLHVEDEKLTGRVVVREVTQTSIERQDFKFDGKVLPDRRVFEGRMSGKANGRIGGSMRAEGWVGKVDMIDPSGADECKGRWSAERDTAE